MKYINWGIIYNEFAEIENIKDLLSNINGANVIDCSSESNAIKIINNNAINAVLVSTPPNTHATYAIMAMNAGKYVLINKPLASKYDDCIRINYASEKLNIPCFVSYHMRYLPYFRTIKKYLKDEIIGDLLQVSLRFYSDENKNMFLTHASQQLDILQYLFGIITEVAGYSANNQFCIERNSKTTNANFKFETGLTGSASWCYGVVSSNKKDEIEIIGSKGALLVSSFCCKKIDIITEKEAKTVEIPEESEPELHLFKAVVEHLQGFNVCNCNSISATPANWVLDKMKG